MSKASLSLQKRGGIAYLTLCRPESQNTIDGVLACGAAEVEVSDAASLLQGQAGFVHTASGVRIVTGQ